MSALVSQGYWGRSCLSITELSRGIHMRPEVSGIHSTTRSKLCDLRLRVRRNQ